VLQKVIQQPYQESVFNTTEGTSRKVKCLSRSQQPKQVFHSSERLSQVKRLSRSSEHLSQVKCLSQQPKQVLSPETPLTSQAFLKVLQPKQVYTKQSLNLLRNRPLWHWSRLEC
jgi:hypothetical protein